MQPSIITDWKDWPTTIFSKQLFSTIQCIKIYTDHIKWHLLLLLLIQTEWDLVNILLFFSFGVFETHDSWGGEYYYYF